jgi:hypothetical protein
MTRLGVAVMSACLGACGGEPQSTECRQFVACVRALDAQDGRDTNTLRFEAGGPCWGGAVGAKLCTDSCARGLVYIRRAASVPTACAAGVAP